MAVERTAQTDFFRFLSLRRTECVLLLIGLIGSVYPIVVPLLIERERAVEVDGTIDVPDLTDDLFWALIDIGEERQKAGEIEKARAAFETARQQAGNNGHDRRFTIASSKIAGLMVDSGSPEAALGIYEKLHATWERRADKRPHDLERLRDLGSSHMILGDLHQDLGETAKASEHYRAVNEVWSFLAERDPGDPEKQHALAQTHIKISDALTTLSDLREARRHAEQARDLYRRLTEADPSSLAWAKRLARTLGRMGDVHDLLDEPDRAFAAYREGLSILEALAKENPDDQAIQYDLGFAYQDLGDSYYGNDQFIDALTMYENRRVLFEKLIGGNPDEAIYRRDLAMIQSRIGTVKLALEDMDGAHEAFTASLDLVKALAAETPEDRGVQSQLAKAYRQMGLFLDVGGEFKEAESALSESRGIYERLIEAEPANPAWPRDLFTVHVNLSDLATNRGQVDTAKEHLTSALSIATTLDKDGLLAPVDDWLIQELQSRLADLDKSRH